MVGFAQAVAIVPGISRSGATIVCGMAGGMAPEESARFSFLLSVPVIAGAGLYEALHSQNGVLRSDIVLPLLAASLVSFLTALVSLCLIFAVVRRIRIDVFGYYTIAAGIAGLGLYYFI
jgi:undecaprenyl-diphosphatase